MDPITSLPVGDSPPSPPANVILVRGRVYEPAIGPRLKALLAFIFAAVALLGATGIYLLAIRLFDHFNYPQSYQTVFSLWMFLIHILLGVAVILPFLIFGFYHFATARQRKNRLAIKLGIIMFVVGIVVVLTGVALIQEEHLPQLPTDTATRDFVRWLHVVLPILAVGLYVMHRRAGPDIRWKWGVAWGVGVSAFCGIMVTMHSHDPRKWHAKGSDEGEYYFHPSLARTIDGNFIPANVMMMDEYCMKCHPDIYHSHLHSVHKNASFNNPAYLFSVRETRRTAGVRAARWCAGCHDPVTFFSGRFDDENFNDVTDKTAHAGITCTVCHSITNVNSRSGNADYTIQEPIHYPLTFSKNPVLQYLNEQLIKAKPDFHKKMFLKPFHKTEAFCSTCHKVGLPQEINGYKEFLRGQNHNDSFWLSGVSGRNARAWYYPPVAKKNCAECHMALVESNDFGARDFDGSGKRKVHNHLFLGANTGLARLKSLEPGADPAQYQHIIKTHTDFLQKGIDGKSPPIRIDLFGLKFAHADRVPGIASLFALPGLGNLAGALTATAALDQVRERGVEEALVGNQTLRPHIPMLTPGHSYQIEVVIRTLNIGHHFTQGTADSNEVWVDFTAKAGGRLIGRSGALEKDEDGQLDPWAHRINVLMLDRHGNRIDRRNPQDIFTPLYDHQIPPGAANVLHYRLNVPRDVKGLVELTVRVRYRKFDYTYMEKVHAAEGQPVPKLPIVDMCSDTVTLPVAGVAESVPDQQSTIDAWQRWNDYGIGCFLEGGPEGKVGGELKMAEEAFSRLLSPEFSKTKDAHGHGFLNLARVHLAYGSDRLVKARACLEHASHTEPPAPWWTVAYFNGRVNLENANFDEAIAQFEKVLDPAIQDTARGFDFSKDFVVINDLGKAYWNKAQQEERGDPKLFEHYLRKAIAQFEKTLTYDPENVDAHEFLNRCYNRLGGDPRALGGLPADLTAAEKKLVTLADAFGDAAMTSDQRFAKAIELNRALAAAAPLQAGAPRLAVLLALREKMYQLQVTATDEWIRLAGYPVLVTLDKHLLEHLPLLTQAFADAARLLDQRLELGEDVTRTLIQIGQRPRRPDLRPSLFPLTAYPMTGSPVSAALAALADRDHLAGGLAPTRWLSLQKLRPAVQALAGPDHDPQVRLAGARALARLHLILHGIFKPDENAQDQAVRKHRTMFPAADHSSHSIIIYSLNQPGALGAPAMH